MTLVPLKRVAHVTAGQSPSSEQVESLSDQLPFLQGNAEFGSEHPDPRWSCAFAPKHCGEGDALLSVRAPVGALNLADRSYGIGRGLCAIRPQVIIRRYLWWALHEAMPRLQSVATGSTYTAVTADEVQALPIWLHKPPQQQAIADFLDVGTSRIDILIAKKRRLSALLDERSTAHREACVVGPGRPSGIPSLGSVPADWNVLRNKVFLREVNDPSPDGLGEMLSVSHLTGVTPRAEKTVYMFEAESTVGYKRVQRGDLVINTMWAWMGAAGVSSHDGIVSPAYDVYRFHSGRVLPDFYEILIRAPGYIEEMTRFSRGVTSSRLRLYPDEFLRLLAPVPPIDEQRRLVSEFARWSSAKMALVGRLERQITLLEEHREALITAAVTGQLDFTRAVA